MSLGLGGDKESAELYIIYFSLLKSVCRTFYHENTNGKQSQIQGRLFSPLSTLLQEVNQLIVNKPHLYESQRQKTACVFFFLSFFCECGPIYRVE